MAASAPGNSDVKILEPRGNHYGWYSLKPLTEAGEWAQTPAAYYGKCKEVSGGAPIYKMHPGLACIALTDHASAKWFFEQPETVLDRQGRLLFGALKCNKELVGDTLPALATNMVESHTAIRDFTMAVFRERLGVTQTALTHASDNFYRDLKENGLGEHTTVYETFIKQTQRFILEWVLGTGEEGGQPLPPFEDFITVNPSDTHVVLGLEIDTPVANLAAQVLQKLKGGVSSKELGSIDVLLESIRSSKMFPKYTEMLEQMNVPLKSVERSFMFNTGFQTCSAISKSMEFAVPVLTKYPDFWADLQKEVDGQELSIDAVQDLTRFPLLDSLHWEIIRMYPVPAFYFKTAKMDLVVPTSNGDRYQVKKGETVCCNQALCQIDELKFGPDGREFNPRRFVGNQELKKDVFAYCYRDPSRAGERVEGMPWGCIGHALGVVDGIMMYVYARWVQEYTWELTEPAVVDADLFLGKVGPGNPTFAKITPRK